MKVHEYARLQNGQNELRSDLANMNMSPVIYNPVNFHLTGSLGVTPSVPSRFIMSMGWGYC